MSYKGVADKLDLKINFSNTYCMYVEKKERIKWMSKGKKHKQHGILHHYEMTWMEHMAAMEYILYMNYCR